MAYFVKQVKKKWPQEVRLIEIPQSINWWHRRKVKLWFYYMMLRLRIFTSAKDTILFMEYLGNRSGNQTGMALKLKKWGVKSKIVGLVHLPGNSLLELYRDEEYISKAAKALDKLIVFGASLSKFFAERGFEKKVRITPHYVETNYYKPSDIIDYYNATLNVIHMGSLKRNFDMLKEIVQNTPQVQFHICMGNNDLTEKFAHLENVNLYGFMDENELLSLMQRCQVSLSILDDTVGSNVITTSMACGLVNVVSDVGSIRDYCNDSNAVLCKTTTDFSAALLMLAKDQKMLQAKQRQSRKDAMEISLEKSLAEFKSILTQ
ncbi:MAG: glycosyltransferase [Bacteroidota bacterium]